MSFHPSVRHSLLSAGTDALITRYDTSIADEDEAVAQVINNGASVHLTGFLNDKIYAASHIETWSVYKQTNKDDESETEQEDDRKEYGDVRESWGCEYIIDVDTINGYVAIGRNSSSKLTLLEIENAEVRPTNRIEFENAHANEVIRSVNVHEKYGLVLSGGEDGCIHTWKVPENRDLRDGEGEWQESKSRNRKHTREEEHKHQPKSKEKRKEKIKEKRFRPY